MSSTGTVSVSANNANANVNGNGGGAMNFSDSARNVSVNMNVNVPPTSLPLAAVVGSVNVNSAMNVNVQFADSDVDDDNDNDEKVQQDDMAVDDDANASGDEDFNEAQPITLPIPIAVNNPPVLHGIPAAASTAGRVAAAAAAAAAVAMQIANTHANANASGSAGSLAVSPAPTTTGGNGNGSASGSALPNISGSRSNSLSSLANAANSTANASNIALNSNNGQLPTVQPTATTGGIVGSNANANVLLQPQSQWPMHYIRHVPGQNSSTLNHAAVVAAVAALNPQVPVPSRAMLDYFGDRRPPWERERIPDRRQQMERERDRDRREREMNPAAYVVEFTHSYAQLYGAFNSSYAQSSFPSNTSASSSSSSSSSAATGLTSQSPSSSSPSTSTSNSSSSPSSSLLPSIPAYVEESWFEQRDHISALKCSICLSYPWLEEAVEVPCRSRHWFCRSCIFRAIDSSQKEECPLCRDSISRRRIYPVSQANPALTRLLVPLKVMCPNCAWKGEFNSLRYHMTMHCPAVIVPCKFSSFGCDFSAQRQSIVTHEKDASVHLSILFDSLRKQQSMLECVSSLLPHSYQIIARGNDRAVTNRRGQVDDGNFIITSKAQYLLEQEWMFIPMLPQCSTPACAQVGHSHGMAERGGGGGLCIGGGTFILLNIASGKVLENKNNSARKKNEIVLATRTNSPAQQWTVVKRDSGYVSILSSAVDGSAIRYAIDWAGPAYSSSMSGNRRIHLWKSLPMNNHQHFTLLPYYKK